MKEIWRIAEYMKYHYDSCVMGDDPEMPCLRYISDKLWYDIEKRLRLALVYSTCYNAPTAYFIVNHLDFSSSYDEILSFWKQNKWNLIFQTDRRRVKNRDEFPKILKSYKDIIWNNTQYSYLMRYVWKSKEETYDNMFEFSNKIYYMWRFASFLYLETVEQLTDFWMIPTWLDLKEALSSCNWLAYALWKDDLVVRRWWKKLKDSDYQYLQTELKKLVKYIQTEYPDTNSNIWNIETTLCAYKKWKWWKRYVWFYIDRQCNEIKKMEKLNNFDFSILREFRKKTFLENNLMECKKN